MKNFTILTCIFFAVVFTAHAQKQERYMLPSDRAAWMIEKMEKNMTLTDEQKVQLNTIFQNSFQKMQTLREDFQKDKTAMQEAVRKNHEETNLQLQKVLTPEQYKQFVAQKNDKQMKRMCKKTARAHRHMENHE